MIKKHKKLTIFLILLVSSVIAAALGLKYFPFSKVMKMPSGSEKEFVNPQTVSATSPNTLYYDFEIPPGKEVPGGFYKGIAHSGQYSVKAFGQNSFSFAIERTAREIGVNNLNAVALSAWIYVFPTKKDVQGSLVFTASNELGVNICWQGISLHEPEIPRGKWFKISGYFDLRSVTFKPDYKIQVYFWNTSSADILIDDYFVSFGNAVDRRGDSTLVDLTKPAGYTPRFNYPPFPVSYFTRESNEKQIKSSEIGGDDIVAAGNFFNQGSDGLMVFRKDGKISGFIFCKEKNAYTRILINKPAQPFSTVKQVIKGRFLGTESDQIVLVTDKSLLLCSLNLLKNPCAAAETPTATMKILSSADQPDGVVYAGDFSGDNRSELLIVNNSGSWKLNIFEPVPNSMGKWKTLAGNGSTPVEEWNQQKFATGISIGSFIPGIKGDQILTATKSKADKICSYTIFRFNRNSAEWESVFLKNGGGKTIGLDTLKPDDKFFCLPTGQGNSSKVFRYNRDWRFDLKEICFNDSTFTILSNVDFQGYDLDQNPKYYESLQLIPGSFKSREEASFLIIGKNRAERHYEKIIPDFIHHYSVSTVK